MNQSMPIAGRARVFPIVARLAMAGLLGSSGSVSTASAIDRGASRTVLVEATSPTRCDLPVDAAISDRFRPPAQPWEAGNRGLTFATVPGQGVAAVAPGIVTFAGRIASAWYVTVELGDGRDVTYSFLDDVAVAAGTSVGVGAPLGTTGATEFHLGLRDGDAYLDPIVLVGEACRWHHAVLVAVPESSSVAG